jgi:hypothetical protein
LRKLSVSSICEVVTPRAVSAVRFAADRLRNVPELKRARPGN